MVHLIFHVEEPAAAELGGEMQRRVVDKLMMTKCAAGKLRRLLDHVLAGDETQQLLRAVLTTTN